MSWFPLLRGGRIPRKLKKRFDRCWSRPQFLYYELVETPEYRYLVGPSVWCASPMAAPLFSVLSSEGL